MKIDLSCDMGEAADPAGQAVEDELWPLVTSASVACGGHAGTRESMVHAVEMARRFGVILAAHPSYPDRENFGRRSVVMDPAVLRESLTSQIEALLSVANEGGVPLRRVKPHGALYNDLHRDRGLAGTVVDAISAVGGDLAIVSSPDSAVAAVAGERGCGVVLEAFADRRYRPDGALVSRSESNALITDPEEAAEQALRLARRGEVVARDGAAIRVPFQTVCIHGDMQGSVARLRAIRARLEAEGFEIGGTE